MKKRKKLARFTAILLVVMLIVGCGTVSTPLQPSTALSSSQTQFITDTSQKTGDFSVKYWETAWDIANVSMGVFDCVWGWDGWACGAAAVDVAATLLPIPGGMSAANRARKTVSSAHKTKKFISYSKHARDRMAERRISEAHVREVIAKGKRQRGNTQGTYVYEHNGRTVVVNENLHVITVYGRSSYGSSSSW